MTIRSEQFGAVKNIRAGQVLAAGDWICFKWDAVNSETRAYKAIANSATDSLVRGYNTQPANVGQLIGLRAFGEVNFLTNQFTSADIGKKIYLSNVPGVHTLNTSDLPRNGTTYLSCLGTVATRKSIAIDIQNRIGPLIPGPDIMSVSLNHATGELVVTGADTSSTLIPELIPLISTFNQGYVDLISQPIDESMIQLYIYDSTKQKGSKQQVLGIDFTLVHSALGGLKNRLIFDSTLVPGVDLAVPDENDSVPTIGLQNILLSSDFFQVYYTI